MMLLALIICGMFWRLGGAAGFSKNWKWIGVGTMVSLIQFALLGNGWVFLYIPALWGLTSLVSYGKNTINHKFWEMIFGPGWWTEFFTRATSGFAWSIAAMIFVFCGGGWGEFFVYMAGLTIANGLVGATITFDELSDTLVGVCVGVSMFV